MGAAIRRYGFSIDVPKTVHLLDAAPRDEGQDASDADLAVLVELAREEGVLLDPLSTARGFRGLVETLSRDPKALGQRVCFIHTGGLFSVFPYRERLSRLIDGGD